MRVDDVQVMPEDFVDTMGNMYLNGGNFYFNTFKQFVDYMFLSVAGGVRFNKLRVIKND